MASAAKSIVIAILALGAMALPSGAGAQDAEGSIELVDPPLVGAGGARGEQRLLRVKDILELVHWSSPPNTLTKRSL